MDKTLDLDELERVAREAASAAETEGRWVVLEDDGDVGVVRAASDDVWIARTGAAGYPAPTARAAHIATFDPPTILTLIAAARPAVVSDGVVEAMARGFLEGLNEGRSLEFDALQPGDWAELRSAMRSALALLPGGVPDGWVLVPREPTREMFHKGSWAYEQEFAKTRDRQKAEEASYRAMLSASPKGSSVAKSAAGDASHLTASETPCKSEWPNPACPCTDPLWCIQRELCKRTAQEPPSPTPCDLEVTDRASKWMLENSEGRWLHNAEDGTFTSDPNLGLKWPNRAAADAFRLGLRGPLWALKLTEHVWIEPEPYDWTDAEDDIADAISDSMDMDWSSRDGARAVVAYLKQIGAKLP